MRSNRPLRLDANASGVDLAGTAEVYDPATGTFREFDPPPLPGLEWTPVLMTRV